MPWWVRPSVGEKHSDLCYVVHNTGRRRRPGEGEKEALCTGALLSFICPELSGSCVRVFEDNQGFSILYVF